MDEAHGRRVFLYVLAAVPRRAIGVHLDVVGVDLDIDLIGDIGHDLYEGKGGVPPLGVVKGRYAHQAMDAPLGAQVAIHILAPDLGGDALDPGLLALHLVDDLALIAMAFRPAQVHAQEHLRPILRLGAPSPGIDRQNRVAGIVRPRHQSLGAHGGQLGLQLDHLTGDLVEHGLVVAGQLV